MADVPFTRVVRAIHSESSELGAMAARCGVKSLVLTHLIPAFDPADDEVRAKFESDIRAGGYDGDLLVANDLDKIYFG